MQSAIVAIVVMLICLAGGLAALSGRQPSPGESASPSFAWWQWAALGSAAVGVAVAVLAVYFIT